MSGRHFQFGHLILEPHRQLLHDGAPVELGRKALELLTLLAKAEGDLVTKDELMAAVWPDVTIEENAVQVHISALRKALGGEADRLRTVHGLGYRLIQDNGTRRHEAAAPASVAVLPFANLTGNSVFDVLADGIAEELINLLSHGAGLQVASRTSSFAYRGHDGDIRQIARELNVSAIVEGSVREAGEMVRITAQLVDGETGFHRWSENYDRKTGDALAIEDELGEIVARIVERLLARNPGTASARRDPII